MIGSMDANEPTLWTIDELAAQAALALSVDYPGQESGRVRDVPDLRTIRYYATLGLLDRPQSMRGRTALYGRRHLLQLVAIKRLQAKGHALGALQAQLVGATDTTLAEIARLPDQMPAPQTAPEERQDFWKQRPAPPPVKEKKVLPLQGIQLDGGITLLLTPARPVEPDDVEALRVAATPLLKLLASRRLLPDSSAADF